MLSRHEPKHILPKRLEFTGIAASDGYALGLLWFAETELASGYTPKQNAAEETHALTAAIETAKHEVLELLAGAKNQAAEILEFQIAVFDDETFQNTAFTEISNGKTAYDSWLTLLNAEIENYQRSNDETFRARALDFQDISARVTRILCSQPSQKIPAKVIVFASNLTPTAFIGHDWQGGGIALTGGSTTSHVAILARQFGVPMVTNIVLENEPEATRALHNGARVLLSSHLKIMQFH